MVTMELSSSSCAEIGVPLDLRWVYQGISVVANVGQATCLVGWGTGHCTRSNTGE